MALLLLCQVKRFSLVVILITTTVDFLDHRIDLFSVQHLPPKSIVDRHNSTETLFLLWKRHAALVGLAGAVHVVGDDVFLFLFFFPRRR